MLTKKVTCANLLTFPLAAFIPHSPSTYWNGVHTFRVNLSAQILSYMLFPGNTPETRSTVARLSIKLCLFTPLPRFCLTGTWDSNKICWLEKDWTDLTTKSPCTYIQRSTPHSEDIVHGDKVIDIPLQIFDLRLAGLLDCIFRHLNEDT